MRELRRLGYDRPPLELTQERDTISLVYAPPDESGFYLSATFEPSFFLLGAEGWHAELEPSDAKGDVEKVARFLDGRILMKEFSSNRKPHRWELFTQHEDGKWSLYSYGCWMFFNFFGRRTVREKRNSLRPDS